MNTKVLIGAVVVLVVAGGAYWWGTMNNAAPTSAGPTTYSWTFQDKTTDASQPKTQVTLVADSKNYVVGTYDGTCSVQNTDLMAGEKSKVICWFAGGGKEVGLFVEGGKWMVKVGDVDEGDAETAGFRGNFQTAVTL